VQLRRGPGGEAARRPPAEPARSPQVERPEDILAADRIVFPGVGAYEQAMGVLARRGYIDPLKEYIQARPVPARPRSGLAAPGRCCEALRVASACTRGTR